MGKNAIIAEAGRGGGGERGTHPAGRVTDPGRWSRLSLTRQALGLTTTHLGAWNPWNT